MDKIVFCKICRVEINKPLLYDHINSKEHRDVESYFIVKCMTYCELCNKEIINDEWREHIISEKHLSLEGMKYCPICNMKYNPEIDATYEYNASKIDIGGCHESGPIHKQNYTRAYYNSR